MRACVRYASREAHGNTDAWALRASSTTTTTFGAGRSTPSPAEVDITGEPEYDTGPGYGRRLNAMSEANAVLLRISATTPPSRYVRSGKHHPSHVKHGIKTENAPEDFISGTPMSMFISVSLTTCHPVRPGIRPDREDKRRGTVPGSSLLGPPLSVGGLFMMTANFGNNMLMPLSPTPTTTKLPTRSTTSHDTREYRSLHHERLLYASGVFISGLRASARRASDSGRTGFNINPFLLAREVRCVYQDCDYSSDVFLAVGLSRAGDFHGRMYDMQAAYLTEEYMSSTPTASS